MDFLKKLSPAWALRLGLGLMFVYSSVDIMRHPTAWHWAVRPIFKWFPLAMQATLNKPENITAFLRGHAVWEMFLVMGLLGWFWPKKFVRAVAALSALEMAAILFLLPIDAVTFRDIGLLGAGVALFLLLSNSVSPVSEQNRPATTRPPGSGPAVETFDQFMGKK